MVSGYLKSDGIYVGNLAKRIRERDKCEIVRTYLLVTQGIVVSTPDRPPKWSITKNELINLFKITNNEFTEEYGCLLSEKYCYGVLLNNE